MSFTATTKRSPAAVAGKIGAPVANLTALALAFVPYEAFSPEVIERYKVSSARKLFITGAFAVVDVVEGDVLSYGGIDYHVRAVGKWTSPVVYTQIVMEQVQ